MSNINQFNQPYFNLIIENDPSAWDKGVITLDRSRFLEYTYGNKFERTSKTLHGEFLEELIHYPCLFLYEEQVVYRNNLPIMGHLGFITAFSLNYKSITINFVIEENLSMNDVLTIKDSLQINERGYGLNRTHWSVKDGNIYQIIESYRHQLENQNIKTRPKVFFSYSWDEDYTSQVVEDLYDILIDQGIDVTYDKRHLKPGHNMSYFMESVHRDNFTKIYVFCDNSYIKKANSLSAGVGVETNLLKGYVNNHPYQTKVIPISLDGSFNVPIFLAGTNGFDLSPSNWKNGVDKIIFDIFNP